MRVEKDANEETQKASLIAEGGEAWWEVQATAPGGSAPKERRAESSREQQGTLAQLQDS